MLEHPIQLPGRYCSLQYKEALVTETASDVRQCEVIPVLSVTNSMPNELTHLLLGGSHHKMQTHTPQPKSSFPSFLYMYV